MSQLITLARLDNDAIWRVTFGATKGNILDRALLEALTGVFRDAGHEPRLKVVCLEGSGAHFSFGASIQEHLPDQVAGMLAGMSDLVYAMADSAVVVAAAVRGQCLGGGLEIATACHRIFSAPDATFGQPEIMLGVFPPLASVLLPLRINRAAAEDLCLTGRLVPAAEAHAAGLVDVIAEGDPAEAAIEWARRHFSARSAASIRLAVRAVRHGLNATLRRDLPRLEAMYLEELMATADAVEGLRAFLEKRPPNWRHA